MKIEPLTLESKFELSKFKLYLYKHPEASRKLAIKNCEAFLALSQAYKKLCKRHESLQSEYSELVDLLATFSETISLSENSND